MTTAYLIALSMGLVSPSSAQSKNLALAGTARSWLANSVASVPAALVNDDDPNNGREPSKRLYEDYAEYRRTLVGE